MNDGGGGLGGWGWDGGAGSGKGGVGVGMVAAVCGGRVVAAVAVELCRAMGPAISTHLGWRPSPGSPPPEVNSGWKVDIR